VTHWMLGPAQPNHKCLSFVAIERLNEVSVDRARCSSKASIGHEDQRKLTWVGIGNFKGFESTGTSRHQIGYRLEISRALDPPQCDLCEVETIREVQQLTSNGSDPPNHTAQLQGPGKSWRSRGRSPSVNPTPAIEIPKIEILEKGK